MYSVYLNCYEPWKKNPIIQKWKKKQKHINNENFLTSPLCFDVLTIYFSILKIILSSHIREIPMKKKIHPIVDAIDVRAFLFFLVIAWKNKTIIWRMTRRAQKEWRIVYLIQIHILLYRNGFLLSFFSKDCFFTDNKNKLIQSGLVWQYNEYVYIVQCLAPEKFIIFFH